MDFSPFFLNEEDLVGSKPGEDVMSSTEAGAIEIFPSELTPETS